MDEEFVQLTKLVQDQKMKILPSLDKCFRQVDLIFLEAKQNASNSPRMKHLFTSRMLAMYTQLNNILYCFEKMVEDDNNLHQGSPEEVLNDMLQLDDNPDVSEEFSVGLDRQVTNCDDHLSEDKDLDSQQAATETQVVHPSATVDELPDAKQDDSDDVGSATSDDKLSASYSRLEEDDDVDGDIELIPSTCRDTLSKDAEGDVTESSLLHPETQSKPVKIVTFADCVGQDLDSIVPSTLPSYSAIDKMLEFRDKAVQKDKENNTATVYSFELEPSGIVLPCPPDSSPVDKRKTEERAKKLALQREELKAGEKTSFCHVVSPSEFYLTTDLELTESIADAVHQHCERAYFIVVAKYPTKAAAHSIVGDYCFAFIFDKKIWRRVVVIDWKWDDDTDSEDVTVQSVDFGFMYDLSFKYLRPMSSQFADCVQATHKCCLAHLYPVGGAPSEEKMLDWPEVTVDALHMLSKTDDKYAHPFRVIYCHKEGDMFHVDLLDESKTNDETLSVKLVKLGLASQPAIVSEDRPKKSEEDPPKNDEADPPKKERRGRGDFEKLFEHLDLNVPETLSEAVAGYDAKDEARICPHTRPDGTSCYKGASCRLEHAQLAPDGWTTDKIGVHCKPHVEVCLPALGELITVCVTQVLTCCRFYGHIIRQPGKLKVNGKEFVFDESFVNFTVGLDKLNVNKMDKPVVMPGIGEIVLVYLPTVEKFFRAVIRSVDQAPEKYEVFFVDFGHVQLVEGSWIRSIKSSHLNLPFQAIEMRLCGYRPRDDAGPDEVRKFGVNNMKFVMFKARAVSFNSSCMLIQMWDSKNPNVEFGQILMRFNFAEQDTCPVQDCEIPLY